ncbi:hypothetical protein NQ314_017439 [Rhamnusium bicolor]|uniref:Uncharacterized protein n=1 Tax=Rhamnusium bicolor TaxID=1586634 RepID=A0AAV8WTQ4_9CUCU|nr:hypothetical protein NQ314_017439 [Rhamnusium bicolor]
MDVTLTSSPIKMKKHLLCNAALPGIEVLKYYSDFITMSNLEVDTEFKKMLEVPYARIHGGLSLYS